MQAIHAPVHTDEETRAIIAAAISIADDLSPLSVEWATVFNQAAELLGKRVSALVQPTPVPFSLPSIPARAGL